MAKAGLKFPVLALHFVLMVVLASTVNLPCSSRANGNFKDCCTQNCGEQPGSEEAAKDCCTQKGTFDTPGFRSGSDSYSVPCPYILAVNRIESDRVAEASPYLYQGGWPRELLKIPLRRETYKLTCTYRI